MRLNPHKRSPLVRIRRDLGSRDPDLSRFGSDLYHHLLTSSWPLLLGQIALAFVAINALFGLGYYLSGGIANARPGSYSDVFFFSVETMATVGYGRMIPVTFVCHILMSIEALFGLIGLALTTGLIFAKFSRPTARVRFSRYAVIGPHDGVPCLMFRLANVRGNQVVEAQIHVVFARQEWTLEGQEIRRFYDLELMRYRNAIFAYSWTVIHPIRSSSPLYGARLEELQAVGANIVASVIGMDEAFGQTIHARHIYRPAEMVWGAQLKDIVSRTPEGDALFDYSNFDQVVPVALPLAGGQITGASDQ